MLMPASLTRSRSREFLASASEPLQPRSLRIQPTLAKKHMYYPYVEKYRRCFPSSICSTLSPRNFFSRCRIEHGLNDFLSRTKLLQHRSNDPFLSKPIWYSCTSALDPPPYRIDNFIRYSSLDNEQFIPPLSKNVSIHDQTGFQRVNSRWNLTECRQYVIFASLIALNMFPLLC